MLSASVSNQVNYQPHLIMLLALRQSSSLLIQDLFPLAMWTQWNTRALCMTMHRHSPHPRNPTQTQYHSLCPALAALTLLITSTPLPQKTLMDNVNTYSIGHIPIHSSDMPVRKLKPSTRLMIKLPGRTDENHKPNAIQSTPASKAMVHRLPHGYGKTRGFRVTGSVGTGTVVYSAYPDQTTYPYRGIAGIDR
jgi:hypothetical protein